MKVKSKKSKEDRREPHVNKTQIDDVISCFQFKFLFNSQ